MKRTIIVDENDNEIGIKDDGEITADDIYRVTNLWVFSSRGEMLLAKRAATKTHNPNKWAPLVAGTVEQGETYETNILKEIKEETGLEINSLNELYVGPKLRMRSKWNSFSQMYMYKFDGSEKDLKIDPSEISELRWIKLEAMAEIMNSDKDFFIPNMKIYLPILVEWFKKIS